MLKAVGVRPERACADIEAVVDSGKAEAVVAKIGQVVKDCVNCQRRISALSGSTTALGMAVKTRRMLQSKLDALPKAP